MKTLTGLQLWIRVVGAIQIALGLLIWSGKLDGLTPFHMLIGVTLVIALWTLAALALKNHLRSGLAIVAICWGLVTPVLGLAQTNLLTGSGHWLIQVLHLLVGLGVIGLGDTLARALKSRRSAWVDAPGASVVGGAR